MDVDTAANSTDKSQPFEIKTEDITNHDDKPRLHLCTACDRRFTTKDILKAHRRIHTEENVYTCSICEKIFFHQSGLSSHKNIHTAQRIQVRRM